MTEKVRFKAQGRQMRSGNHIGARGESIAFTHLARICRPDRDLPYFDPHFLGEKCKTFDYLVELVDAGEIPLFFFVQVKATSQDYTKTREPPRLPVQVSEEGVRQMAACPVPTYIVGVRDVDERAFIVAVHGGMSGAIASITTAHELTPVTLPRLWEEVRDFWKDRRIAQTTSYFTN